MKLFPKCVPVRFAVLTVALLPAALLLDAAHAQTALVTVTSTAAVAITTNIPVPASSGSIYVLEKYSPGRLTLSGQITGGAGSTLRTTTHTSGDTATTFEFAAANSSFSGYVQTYRGSLLVDNPLSLGTGTILGDGNNGANGDLSFNASMTFPNALVMQSATSLSSGANNVVMTGPISGAYNLAKYGSGTLTLSGANTYSGSTLIGSSAAAGGTLAIGVNNGLPAKSAVTVDNRAGSSVLNLGAFNQNVGAITLYAGGAIRTIIAGSGTLALSGNLTLVDPHTTGAGQDYALAIATPMDLNGATRTFTIGYGNNGDSGDLGDLHLNGAVMNSSGTAGLIFTNWSNGGSNLFGSVTLGAANTYNGPTRLYGGTGSQGTSTLALNANNALPNNSAFIQSANTLLDLTAWGATAGISTGMGSLTGAGTISLGSTGVLTIGYDNTSPAAYTGIIGGAGGSMVKTGSGTLTLSGVNTYTGATTVNGGILQVNGSLASGSAVTVNANGTLAGTGTINGPVAVLGGGGLASGSSVIGALAINNTLTLAANSTTVMRLNNNSGVLSNDQFTGTTGVTYGGTLVVTAAGNALAVNDKFILFNKASGSYAGSFSTLNLPTLPAGLGWSTAGLTVDGSVMVISTGSVLSVTWAGSPANNWDLSGNNVWLQTGTTTPTYYTNGDNVVFDDTATNFTVNLAATVQPNNVVFSNFVNNYTVGGAGGISNNTSLTMLGGATLTLATTNSYSGNTTVGAGKLVLGASGAIPGGSGAGSVLVNGTLDVAGYNPTVNNLTGTGTVDNVSAGGSPVLSVYDTAASSFAGTIQNSSGALSVNKSGSGVLTLLGTNSFSGGTTIAAGSLNITTPSALGSGPVTVTENLAGGSANFLTIVTNAALTLSNNLVLPNASGTYVLTKNAGGQLTLAGAVSGGGSGLLLQTTTDTTGDSSTIFEFANANAAYSGGIQTFRGSVQVDNPLSLGTGAIYGDANNGSSGDLFFNSSMTFANPLVLQSATSISSGTNSVTMSGGVSGSVTNGANLTKYGAGTLNLTGNLAYNGGLVANAGTLAIGSLILAGDTTSGGGLGATYTNFISIAAGATVQSAGTLSVYESSSLEPFIGVSGAGTLALTATNNNATSSPDISFAANDTIANGTANWGARIATPVYLGSAQRYIWGRTDHTSVDVYGCLQADCQLGGPISGSGGMTFVAQNNSSGSDGQLMETPFCLNATNTFTGPVQIQRGSVYLGTNVPASTSPFPSGNVLNFNVASGNNGKFFLSGHNTTISDLSSTGAGTALIANGNRNPSPIGPATLTITQNNPETFSGTIIDTNAEYVATTTGATTTLGLVKNGPAALTLNGTIAFSGTMAVNAGKLYVNTVSSGGGAVTVNSGGTLGGNGTIPAAVTVSNGASLEAGGGMGLGSFSVKSLNLGVQTSDAITLNCEAVPSGINSLTVQNANGLTNNATVTVNILGVLPAATPAVYTLVSYTGAIQGSGSFLLGSAPDQAVAFLTNNTAASAIQLVVSSVTIPSVTWAGSPTNDWDLLGGDVWKQTGSNLPAAYADNDQVVFDDSATNFFVNLAGIVSPNGVLFANNLNNYVFIGSGGISGYTALTEAGTGTVTMVASNSYSGPTLISSGTLALGAFGAIPSGPGAGNVTVNGTLDLGGFSPVLNNLSGAGVVDNVGAGGSPVLTVSNYASSVFAGVIQNSSGTVELNKFGNGTLTLAGNNTYGGVTTINGGVLQAGNGGVSGALGSGPVLDLATLAFNRSDSNTVPNSIAGSGGLQQNGTGVTTMAGNLTYTGPTVANAGTLVFPNDVTFDAGAGNTLTVAANAVVDTGFEIFLNANSSSVAVDISGAGTTRLISTLNRIESYADMIIGANNNGISTANYGVRIASGLDLGSAERLFWAYSSRDDVTTFGLNGCDCQFAGTVSGTAQLILLGQNSWSGVNTMEEQFAFTGSNIWAGPLEVRRGSVYLGNTNAMTMGNVLILDPAASVNSRLFLYGYNATFSDLQSGGYGHTIIANGNNLSSTNVGPATLTVLENVPTTFAGNIVDWYTEYTAPVTGPLIPTLSLVKNGASALTLTGTNTYSGATTINSGELYINNSSTGGGAVTVNTNATLGGSGVIDGIVTVKNGGAIEAGGGAGNGDLQLSGLILGVSSGDFAVLNLTPNAVLDVTSNNGLVVNGGAGSVTINIGGGISANGVIPLITYAGTLGGAGYGAFQLGSTPIGILGYLSNDTAHASIDFVATQVTIPRWSGALSSAWSTDVLPLPKNWVLDSDGVTPEDYVDGENVKFDDTAVSTAVTISEANVSPVSIVFSNSTSSYTVSGAYGISGAASLTKLGTGKVTLGTADSYTGPTTISAGTIALGAAGAIPGGAGAGSVTLNGKLDVAGFSPTLNNLSGSGTMDDAAGGGSPVVAVNETANTVFSGAMQNSSGSLGLSVGGNGTLTLNGASTYSGPTQVGGGALSVNGTLGVTAVTVQSGAALGGTGKISGPVTLAAGAALNLAANAPLTVGALTLNGVVTVNAIGNISITNSVAYVLLNYTAVNATNLFQLSAVPGILNSGYTAALNVTTNQLQLIIAPTKPTGTIADVRHIVIFTQENRSFDHYLGSLHGVHGFSDHVTLTLTNGNSVLYQPSGSSYELPFHTTVQCINDLAHDWSTAHQEADNGWHDQWIAAKGTESMAYYERSDMAYHYALADAFTVCDEYHCCALTSTDPNRLYIFTGMIDPTDTGGGPVIDNTEPSAGWGTNWVTYAETLQKAGVSWKVYQASDNYDDNALAWFASFKNASTGSALYQNGMADVSNLTNGFAADVSNNVLPSVSWIVGPDYGSEHPYWGPGVGANITANLLNALAANPQVYNNTVFILNWDEGDGYFDHEVPVLPPAGTTNEFVSGAPIGLGERVPCIIISPWSRGGYVCSQVFDHTSVIRFIEKWTGVKSPNVSAWRRQVCGDLTSAFDFAHPNTNWPAIVDTEVTTTCGSGTTATPPSPQVVPVQEAGTLIERPLPYQPNAFAALNCTAGNCNIIMTNAGSVSMHFAVYPNAYSTILPQQYDVNPTNSTAGSFSTLTTGGNYDFSCYSANGFLRRFAGNLNADCGQIESASYLNPFADGFKITLANPGASNVVFSVTNGYFANSLNTYSVPANSTNVVFLDASTNNGWYDLTVTASADSLFVRRFAGHIETNGVANGIVSSENPSGYKDPVTFTAAFVGYGTPSGSVQFLTNGVAFGAPVTLSNGVATLTTALLPRAIDIVAAAYSGDALNAPATNTIAQLVLNHPPVPGTVVYQHPANVALRIAISDLLTNVVDADGDTITLVGVGTDGLNLVSTNGTTLFTNGTYILYTNSVTPNVNDSFEYTVSDGNGGVSLGTVLILVNSTNITGQLNANLILSSTNATATFFGVPGYQYAIDRSTNLAPGVGSGWVSISTNLAPVSGIIQVQDSFQDLGIQVPPLPPNAYYRLRYNP